MIILVFRIVCMLNMSNVRNFKSELENILVLTNQLIQTRESESLFDSEKDLRDSKIASRLLPEQYYNFRFFDTSIELKYNHRIKRYFIRFDSTDFEIVRLKEFYKTFEDYIDFNELENMREGRSFYSRKELSFEGNIDLFGKFCLFYISKKIHTDLLFEVF